MSKATSSGGLGFERMAFFSDAVFAIAITLLVLDLRLPAGAHGTIDFAALQPKLVGFGVSFFVVGLYWLAHHRLVETLQAQDGRLLAANLVFLAAVAFLPFPTSVISEQGAAPEPVTFYALSVTAIGILLVFLTLIARRGALMRSGETAAGTAHMVIRSLAVPAVFLGSVSVAQRDPVLAMMLWALSAPAVWIADGFGRLLERIGGKAAV